MRAYSPFLNRWQHRSVGVACSAAVQPRISVASVLLAILLLVGTAQSLLAQTAQEVCTHGKIVTSRFTTVVRERVTLQPGPLFATSGSFAEKPVDTACDPGQVLGPFLVDAGGTLVARLAGDPPAPNQWSGRNYGTGLTIVWEPLLGAGQYGPGQTVVNFAIPAQESEAELSGSWPGPGRLRATMGAPWGMGAYTYSCFAQSYSAEAEIVEVSTSLAAQSGMAIQDGDHIITADNMYSFALLAAVGSTIYVGPESDVSFTLPAATWEDRVATWSVATDRLALAGSAPSPRPPVASANLEQDFVNTVVAFLRRVHDDKTADRILTLYGEGKLVFGELIDSTAEWDRDAGVLTVRKGILNALHGDAVMDFRTIIDAAQSMTHELVHADQGKMGWNSAVYSNYMGLGHEMEADAYYGALDAVDLWLSNVEAAWNHQASPCDQLGSAREAMQLMELWQVYHNDIQSKSLADRAAAVAAYEKATKARDQTLANQTTVLSRLNVVKQELSLFRHNPARLDELRGRLAILSSELATAEQELQRAEAEYTRLDAMLALDGGYPWFELRERTQKASQIAFRLQEVKAFHAQLVQSGCVEPPQPYMQAPVVQCEDAPRQIKLQQGSVHVVGGAEAPAPNTATPSVQLEFDQAIWVIIPAGTEYIIERLGDTAIVRVLDGALNLTGPDGEVLRVLAGEQATLPNGEIAVLEPLPLRRVGGIPLNEIHLDSDIPEPPGSLELRTSAQMLPEGWLWQETNYNLDGPGDATLDVVDETTLRIVVPDGNNLWERLADAPRLLHKITGDFDLEADMLMEMQATHLAYSEFVLYSPDVPVGYLHQQMTGDSYSANYLILGGGWARADGLNKLRVVNRSLRDSVDAPDTPVRVKFVRRGDLFKTYWSLDDGVIWTLSSRAIVDVPETIWVGWVFKRIAADGLVNEPAITTLSNIRLTGARLGSLPNDDWDLAWPSTTIDLGADLFMMENGPEGSYLQAYSPWAIPGDFDLIVNFDASPLTAQPGQERSIHIAVTSPDEKNHAYVRQHITADRQRMDADMSINGGWNRYHYTPTDTAVDASGRVRLVRDSGIVSGYTWQGDDWVQLADWQDDFSGPVYVNFQFNWISPTDDPQTAWISVERLETDAGLLIETVALTEDTSVGEGDTPGEGETPVDKAAEIPMPLPTVSPTPTPAPILTGDQRLETAYVFDDFSSDALGWSVRDNESATTGYADATYTMLVKQPTFWIMSKIPGDFAPELVEFDATVLPGSADGMYGVICHYRNGDNYDFVSVNPETLGVAAGRMAAGSFEFLSSGPGGVIEQPAKHLVRDINATNRVRITCLPDRLEVALNGEAEGSWALEPPADGGNAALFVYGFGPMQTGAYTVAFDNLAGWRDAPSAAAAQCEIPVDPAIAPQWDMARLGCPTEAAIQSWASVQAFERGLMLWRQDVTLLLYTFADGDGWEFHWDEWYKGAVLPDRGVPPPGLQAPLLNFGYLWATNDQVFSDLGWARWEESTMCATIQSFEHGFVVLRSAAPSCKGRVNPPASGWFGSVEATHDGAWR